MIRTRWQATGLLFSLLALACASGSSSDKDDTAADTGGATDTAGGADSGSPDTNTDTDTEPVGLVALEDPCLGGGTPYGLLFQDGQTGFVGCGNGFGLWQTDDQGDSFSQAHPSGSLYVSSLALDAQGRLLVCGRDYETSKGMLYRADADGWSLLARYGTSSDPQDVSMSNCGVVADAGDGRLMMASLTVGDIVVSEDGGQSWSAEERYWEDDNFERGGYAYYYMLSLDVDEDGAFVGAGSQITQPPVFFGPSSHAAADWQSFDAHVVDDSIIGEVWAMDAAGDGAWVVGGRDQGATSRASGFIYRSDDGGLSWTEAALPDGVDIVHDIRFDGDSGIAVGHRYPTSEGGFVLLTDDGGRTWAGLDEAVPLLQSAAIVGDTYWIAGDAYLARGSL